MAKRRKSNAAPALRAVLLQPDGPDGPSAKEEKPIIAERHWPALPLWIALHAERGPIRKCWSGCRLFHVPQDGRRYKRCEIRGCGVQPAAGSAVMACPKCRWMVCRPNPSPTPGPNPNPEPKPNRKPDPNPLPTPRWMVCKECCARQPLPPLASDPLFHGDPNPNPHPNPNPNPNGRQDR